MLASRRAQFVAYATCAVVAGAVSADSAGSYGPMQVGAQPPTDPVRLQLELVQPEVTEGENPSFSLSLRNLGEGGLLLNGGYMLGNGQQSWSSIECAFHNREGQSVPLSLHWGVSHVGGRIYFLGLPLRPDAVYSIPVTPRDYFVSVGKPLSPGMYALQCSYTGSPSPSRESTQLPACWEGRAVSQSVHVMVRPAKPIADSSRRPVGPSAAVLANHGLQPTAARSIMRPPGGSRGVMPL